MSQSVSTVEYLLTHIVGTHLVMHIIGNMHYDHMNYEQVDCTGQSARWVGPPASRSELMLSDLHISSSVHYLISLGACEQKQEML